MAIKQEFIHSFGGFGGYPSRCHIRVLDDQEKSLVILCSQMTENPGTSVTNAAEIIAKDIKNYFELGNVTLASAMQNYIKKSRLTNILGDLIGRLKESKSLTIFALESIKLALEYRERHFERTGKLNGLVWVEHYAPDIGLAVTGSYAIVTFSPETWTPSWEHVSLSEIAERTGYPIADFQVPIASLA